MKIFLKIIDEYKANDARIVKEVATILNCLFQCLRLPQNTQNQLFYSRENSQVIACEEVDFRVFERE